MPFKGRARAKAKRVFRIWNGEEDWIDSCSCQDKVKRGSLRLFQFPQEKYRILLSYINIISYFSSGRAISRLRVIYTKCKKSKPRSILHLFLLFWARLILFFWLWLKSFSWVGIIIIYYYILYDKRAGPFFTWSPPSTEKATSSASGTGIEPAPSTPSYWS